MLPGFDPELVQYAVKYLEEQGVEFRINTPIEQCDEDGVTLKGGEEIKAATVVWTGGVRGNRLIEEAGFETMRGRVKVDEYLRAPGYEDVFIIGDCSLVFNGEGRPYPPTAQIASQQGSNGGQEPDRSHARRKDATLPLRSEGNPGFPGPAQRHRRHRKAEGVRLHGVLPEMGQ